MTRLRYVPSWADVLEENAAEEATARRLIGQLYACEAAALAFCRLLERWARGEARPATAGSRQAALRHAADRAETALRGSGLEYAIFRPSWIYGRRDRSLNRFIQLFSSHKTPRDAPCCLIMRDKITQLLVLGKIQQCIFEHHRSPFRLCLLLLWANTAP